jgi:putative integral membrane protein (TIGR02587 family)
MPSTPATTRQDALESRLRSLCGAFLFAIPIIYTMELWQLGHSASVGKVLGFLALAYVLDVGLNVTSGFRKDGSLGQYLKDGTETLAIGIVVGGAMLMLLGINRLDDSPAVFLRQVLMLAMPISMGASLARTLLGEKGEGTAPTPDAENPWTADAKDLGVTVAGGVFLAYSMAPTEEVLILAMHAQWPTWLAAMALSIGLSYIMIFHANFIGQYRRQTTQGILQSKWGETVVTYAVSLMVSACLIWFLGFDIESASWGEWLAMTVMLGLPASVGGAAGRLIV